MRRLTYMTKTILSCFAVIICLFFTVSARAEASQSSLSKEDAIKIISTIERLNPRHYKVIHIMDGTQDEKCGFRHHAAKRVSFLGPNNGTDTNQAFRHYTLLYSVEYGWFFQKGGRDARGFFLEISSQTKGQVFVR